MYIILPFEGIISHENDILNHQKVSGKFFRNLCPNCVCLGDQQELFLFMQRRETFYLQSDIIVYMKQDL